MVSAAAVQTAIAGRWSFDDPVIEYESRSVAIVCVGFEDAGPDDSDRQRLKELVGAGDGFLVDVVWPDFLIVFATMSEALALTRALHEHFAQCIRIGVNYSESLATPEGRPGDGAHFARHLMARCEPGGIAASAVTGNHITSTMTAAELDRDEPRSRWYIVAGALQLSILLAYFLAWWYGIYWKAGIIALTGSFTCWPEWLCR